jgi:hypothetical protein
MGGAVRGRPGSEVLFAYWRNRSKFVDATAVRVLIGIA